MIGSSKQVAWAEQIKARYAAAREAVAAQIKSLPAANQEKINAALALIDAKIANNDDASDVIARGGCAYFDRDDQAHCIKALKDAVMSIARGGQTVISH